MSGRPGALIREARRRARLSQTDLARRAGVAQSVISAYESGHREPGIQTFTKLIEATGHRLTFTLTPAPPSRLGLPDTRLGRRLRLRLVAFDETTRHLLQDALEEIHMPPGPPMR